MQNWRTENVFLRWDQTFLPLPSIFEIIEKYIKLNIEFSQKNYLHASPSWLLQSLHKAVSVITNKSQIYSWFRELFLRNPASPVE